jgi:hypothetical protein
MCHHEWSQYHHSKNHFDSQKFSYSRICFQVDSIHWAHRLSGERRRQETLVTAFLNKCHQSGGSKSGCKLLIYYHVYKDMHVSCLFAKHVQCKP